ncbi:PREDICTED: histone-lysine N-methyltransferase SETDB2 isoform X4 [Miniopterus natalensis]|uniref:histone-lysine N-methyltransferase SETDB2 isoform X4 n=1 Tax=Miniopterus natalensis TaxID=291302 RepID=UPI0007A6F719|nr:PREDICTED: histone-lysine N-methyltransferase SETDB2 isoform X4 [Miniopterus natalensis]
MERRTCALCPKNLECSVLYCAQSEDIAAHENCLLYSSALVECENDDPKHCYRSFDVEAVKKEIFRGRRLKCRFCGERGATVGCDEKTCAKSYHFFCAKNDHAVLTTGVGGIYKVFCQQHAPSRETESDLPSAKSLSHVSHPHCSQKTTPKQAHFSGMKRKRRKKGHSTSSSVQIPESMTLNRPIKQMEEENGRHTDSIAKIAFLKKCKEAGLLNDLFEEIVHKLHLIQERLMDETTSESDYEEIGTSLFDCRLFEDAFVNFQEALENNIHQFEEKWQQMKEEIMLLQDLKQTLYSVQENRDQKSISTSPSSLSP